MYVLVVGGKTDGEDHQPGKRKSQYACVWRPGGAFRRAEGRFLAEGRKLCPELCRGAELETLFCTESALEKCPELSELPGEHYLVEDHVADKLADVGTHQGVFGVFRTPVHTLEEVKTGGRYLALERVQDPGNVGTLLRSAAAFGFDGVLLSDGCASVFAPKTLRASMGAAVRIPVIEAGKMPEAIALLREEGHHLPCRRPLPVPALECGRRPVARTASASSSAARVRASPMRPSPPAPAPSASP